MIKIGSVIDGKYKILNLIGQGGMSNVYLAINEKANKTWAIKEVRKQGIKNFEIYRQSLAVELNLLKKMNHPNLPNIIDVIDEDDEFFIVMDYIEGMSLDNRIQEQGSASQEEVISWALQLCDVLDYLHHQSPPVIYRDMKPSNIMLKPDGKVVLVDFGTAREYKNEKGKDTTCLGTIGYAAPEQFGGMGQTDQRTDVFNLGATMYHLLTGHDPSMPPYEMYPIRQWNPELSSGLEYIISTCTNKNPDERYQTAKELKFALQNYRKLDESSIRTYRRRLGVCMACLLIGLLCATGSIILTHRAKTVQQEQYIYWLDQAVKMTASDQKLYCLQKAMEIQGDREEAYDILCNQFIEDGVFDQIEEKVLLEITASTQNVLQIFEHKNPQAYADFCYRIGNAYWYYYQHEESRQVNAVSWYQSASDMYEKLDIQSIEYQRTRLYLEIGSFYKKIISAQIDGSDPGMYADYWHNLMKLKRINDENPDRDIITIRMYLEIVSKATEYARYFAEDGVGKSEILNCFNEILLSVEEMEIYATQNMGREIEQVRNIISQAKPMLDSSYLQ